MTADEIRAEAAWMLDYIAREWAGCKPRSRFARSLPAVLEGLIGELAAKDDLIRGLYARVEAQSELLRKRAEK